jgi:hypothetical protein
VQFLRRHKGQELSLFTATRCIVSLKEASESFARAEKSRIIGALENQAFI